MNTPRVADAHTVGRLLADRAGATPARIAIDDRGVTIDYATLDRRATALGDTLRRAGYGCGDRVATVSGSSIDHVIAFFACARIGAAFVPLSWRGTPRELAETLSSARPALILLEEDYLGLALDAVERMPQAPPTALLGTTGVESEAPPRIGGRGEGRAVRDEDPLLIIYTSGSEAAPKGVVLTHENVFWNNLALAGAAQLTSDDVVLAILPQFHIAAWNCQPLLAWWVGAKVVLERSFQPERVLQLITQRAVTAMMGVPTQYRMIADARGFSASAVHTLRRALAGGATLPADVAERWRAVGVELTAGYGLTEAGPNVLCMPEGERSSAPGAVGRPYPHVEVGVADPETGLFLHGDAAGELWVRGPSVFSGYLHDEAATARAMAGDWLRTGDIVHRDADGMFRIVDRRKDIFISGGENVAPAEVERALMLHPAIAEAAVVGVPDEVWGERGVAFIVRSAGSIVGEDEVIAHARAQLAGFKVPVRVAFVDELPRSAIDKLTRARLRDQARALVQEASHDAR